MNANTWLIVLSAVALTDQIILFLLVWRHVVKRDVAARLEQDVADLKSVVNEYTGSAI